MIVVGLAGAAPWLLETRPGVQLVERVLSRQLGESVAIDALELEGWRAQFRILGLRVGEGLVVDEVEVALDAGAFWERELAGDIELLGVEVAHGWSPRGFSRQDSDELPPDGEDDAASWRAGDLIVRLVARRPDVALVLTHAGERWQLDGELGELRGASTLGPWSALDVLVSATAVVPEDLGALDTWSARLVLESSPGPGGASPGKLSVAGVDVDAPAIVLEVADGVITIQEAAGSIDGRAIIVRDARLGRGQLDVDGGIDGNLALSAHLTGIPTPRTLVELRELMEQFDLGRWLDSISGEVTATLVEQIVAGHRLRDLTARAQVSDSVLDLEEMSLELDGLKLTGHGQLSVEDERPMLELTMSSDSTFDVPQMTGITADGIAVDLVAMGPPMGSLDLDATLAGTQMDVEIGIAHVRALDLSLDDFAARLHWAARLEEVEILEFSARMPSLAAVDDAGRAALLTGAGRLDAGGERPILTRWPRMRRISSVSWIMAMTFISDPHLGQTSGSTS